MNKKEVRALVIEPGEYDTRISKVSSTETAIHVHFLAFAPNGHPEDDVYEVFDFRTPRKDLLVSNVLTTLKIGVGHFAQEFDSEKLSDVALKLNAKLAGHKVQVGVRGSMVYYTNDANVLTNHLVEWKV